MSHQLCFIRCRRQHLQDNVLRRYSQLQIKKKPLESSFWKVMDSFVWLAYSSLAASRTPIFSTITDQSKFYFIFRRFIVLGQTKAVISMNYDSSTSSWEAWRWGRFGMILTRGNININSNWNPFTKFMSTSRSTEFKDIFPWIVSQIITKAIPISMRIVIMYVMKRGVLIWVWWKVNQNWCNHIIKISYAEIAFVAQILASSSQNSLSSQQLPMVLSRQTVFL